MRWCKKVDTYYIVAKQGYRNWLGFTSAYQIQPRRRLRRRRHRWTRKHDQTVGYAGPNRATIERPKYRWWRVSKKRSYLSLGAAGTARKGRKREWKKLGRRDGETQREERQQEESSAESVSVWLSSSRLMYLIRRRVPVRTGGKWGAVAEGKGGRPREGAREGRRMEYIRGILNNFWRLTGATKQLAAVGGQRGHWTEEGPRRLCVLVWQREEKSKERRETRIQKRGDRGKERERGSESGHPLVVRTAFFVRNLPPPCVSPFIWARQEFG